MKLLNKIKSALRGRSSKMESTVDSVVRKVDDKTKGKYSDKLTMGADKVKGAVIKLDEERTATSDQSPQSQTQTPGATADGSVDPSVAAADPNVSGPGTSSTPNT